MIELHAGPYSISVHPKGEGELTGSASLAPYLSGSGPKHAALELFLEAPVAAFEPMEEEQRLEGHWTTGRVGGEPCVRFWCGLVEEFALEARGHAGGVASVRVLERHPHQRHLGFLLSSPLRWLVAHRIAEDGGFLLHGAGIRNSSGASIAATGPSGAGKSTLGSFFLGENDFDVLTDETLALLPGESGWTAWGTPWCGMLEVANSSPASLSGLFFLEKTSSHRLSPISAGEAFSRIWSEVFVPPAAGALTVDAVERFLRQVPARVLGFRKDKSVVDFVRASL